MPQSILETEQQCSALVGCQSELRAQDSAIDGDTSTFREPPLIEPLRYETGRAALTSGGSEIVSRVLTIVLSIVTARMLEPVEVGLLGLAVIVIGLVSMLAFYPETAAVAARGKESDHQYALACVEVRATVAAFSLISLWLALPVVTHYLTGKEGGSEPLRELLRVLTWVPLLEVASGYPQVLMQRRLELSSLARIQLLQPIVFVCLAVVFLLTGHRYIGVAWASVVSAFVTALLLWWRLLSTKELSWEGWPSRAIRRQTWHGTGKVLLGGFGGYLGGRIDNLLVSASIGPAAMSFYSMAWNASRTPANVFAKAITFVLVPAVARIQDDPARLQRALRECLRNSYLVLTPVCALLFVTAPLLVSYVIGPKWLPLVPALRVMCFTVLCGPMLFALGAFLTGIGRAHLVGIANVIQIVLLLGGIPFFATRWGVLGAAFGDLLAVFVLTLALFVTTRIATGLPNGKLVATVLLPVVAAIAAGSLAWGVGAYIVDDLTRLLSEVALVSIGYLLAVLAFGGRGRLFDLSALLRDIYALPGAGQPAVKGKMNISSQRQNLTVRAAAWYLRDFPVTRGKGWVNRILGKFIIVKVFDGTKLRLINPLEYHQKPLLFGEEEYEPQIVSLLANALGPGKVFFDVGANMGYHSLLASKIVGSEGRVHAFEPSPAQFKHLKLNVGINQAGNVVLNNSAVAESSEDRELYISVGWNQGTHSLRRTADQGESCRVGCVSIDDYVEKSGIKRIDAIKVDVEGAELFVFKGAQRVLGSMPPPLLVFESCEGFSQSFAYSTRDAKQMIAQYGYALYNIELGPEPVQVSSSSIERYANIVAIHSSADDCYNRALYTACKSGGVGIVGKGLVR